MAAGRASARGDKSVVQGAYGEAFVVAIAAAAGYDVAFPRLGQGIDIFVFERGPKGTSGRGQVVFQVKSWASGTLKRDGTFHYPLEVDAYNALAGEWATPHYLVLCVVPNDAAEYSDANHPRLTLRHAAYWLSLKDEEPDESLKPKSKKVVRVPARNLLTPTTMRALVERHEDLAVIP